MQRLEVSLRYDVYIYIYILLGAKGLNMYPLTPHPSVHDSHPVHALILCLQHPMDAAFFSAREGKLSLCSNKHHAMKMYGGVVVQCHIFLTSCLGGSALRFDCFTPGSLPLSGIEHRSFGQVT